MEENKVKEKESPDFIYSNIAVECHMKWMLEFLELVPKHLIESRTYHDFISSLLQSNRLSEEEEALFRRVTDLSWKLNLASQYAYIEDFDTALKFIKMAQDELDFHMMEPASDKPSLSHVNAYTYVIDTSTYVVVRQMLRKMGLADVEIFLSPEVLIGRWNELMDDKKSKAVLVYLKASMASSMRLDNNFVLENMKKAVELEPDFHGWFRYVYRKIRQIRRSGPKRTGDPCKEEIAACDKAYSLRPDLADNISNLANLKEEILKRAKRTRSMSDDKVAEEVEKMVGLLESCLKLCEDPWVKIRLAEIYGFGGYHLDPKTGEELLKQCIDKWPLNTMVWHKAGKFYHLGGLPRGSGPFVNYRKAAEYYQHALELKPSNFPCIMDYLKLLRNHLDGIDQVVEVIDKFLPSMKTSSEYIKLVITKGLVQWVRNMNQNERKNSCEVWVELIRKFPIAITEVLITLKSKRHEVVGLFDINVDEVVAHLKKIRNENTENESNLTEVISKLILELQNFKSIPAKIIEKATNGVATIKPPIKDPERGGTSGITDVKIVEVANGTATIKSPVKDAESGGTSDVTTLVEVETEVVVSPVGVNATSPTTNNGAKYISRGRGRRVIKDNSTTG